MPNTAKTDEPGLIEAVNDRLEKLIGVRIKKIRPEPPAPPPPPVRPPARPDDRLLTDPVFLISSVRSGSTLLRLILNAHSQIHAPHETHFRRLYVSESTPPVQQAMELLDLNSMDLEHLLWDRLLQRELSHSGKSVLVEKTPSNVFAVDRLAVAWPGARFVYLLRHPASVATSWHEAAPDTRPMAEAVPHTLKYMREVELQRHRHPGLDLRYEDLTADPERETRRITEFLGLEWEPQMLDYGASQQGDYRKGIGDWRDKIRTGSVQAGRPLPAAEDVPAELREITRTWGY